MQFVDNVNPNPLASRNAADITLTGATASKVTITISRDNSAICTFTAEPYSGNLTIRLSDILESITRHSYQQPPQNYGEAILQTITIEAEADGESPASWNRTVFKAGYDRALHSLVVNSYWWTWRDQKCRTFVDGKEFIGALFSNSASIRVTASFADGTTDSDTIRNVAGDTFALIDVSYEKIAALFPGKTIRSYRIYRSDSSYPQVYEVSRLHPRGVFIFRNSMGLFDTVYATGRIYDGANRDVKTFIGSDRAENISSNDSRERISVNSGHIDTRGERALWEELILSTDVWEYKDGRLRKIVIDAFETKLQQAASASMTFEYHYSENPTGYGYEKSVI